jgi:hypothetical protein
VLDVVKRQLSLGHETLSTDGAAERFHSVVHPARVLHNVRRVRGRVRRERTVAAEMSNHLSSSDPSCPATPHQILWAPQLHSLRRKEADG